MILPTSIVPLEPANTTKSTYSCKWCRHTFVREAAFLNHQCKQMRRAEEFQTPIGQTAWRYYDSWLRAKNRQPPPAQSFLDSKFYMTFINFVKFTKAVNLPNVERFIKYMVSRDYQPSMWISNVVYVEYLEYLDRRVDPVEQAKETVDTILWLSEKLGIDSSELFKQLDTNELIQLIQARKLSPWVLLFSETFSHHYQHIATPEQKVLIETLIRPEYWSEQFEKYADEIEKIKNYINALDL